MTTAERLTRIETILEEKLASQISQMAEDIKAIRTDLDDDKAELAGLKNKGTGILIGVAIASSAFGASVATGFRWLTGLFH